MQISSYIYIKLYNVMTLVTKWGMDEYLHPYNTDIVNHSRHNLM